MSREPWRASTGGVSAPVPGRKLEQPANTNTSSRSIVDVKPRFNTIHYFLSTTTIFRHGIPPWGSRRGLPPDPGSSDRGPVIGLAGTAIDVRRPTGARSGVRLRHPVL